MRSIRSVKRRRVAALLVVIVVILCIAAAFLLYCHRCAGGSEIFFDFPGGQVTRSLIVVQYSDGLTSSPSQVVTAIAVIDKQLSVEIIASRSLLSVMGMLQGANGAIAISRDQYLSGSENFPRDILILRSNTNAKEVSVVVASRDLPVDLGGKMRAVKEALEKQLMLGDGNALTSLSPEKQELVLKLLYESDFHQLIDRRPGALSTGRPGLCRDIGEKLREFLESGEARSQAEEVDEEIQRLMRTIESDDDAGDEAQRKKKDR